MWCPCPDQHYSFQPSVGCFLHSTPLPEALHCVLFCFPSFLHTCQSDECPLLNRHTFMISHFRNVASGSESRNFCIGANYDRGLWAWGHAQAPAVSPLRQQAAEHAAGNETNAIQVGCSVRSHCSSCSFHLFHWVGCRIYVSQSCAG